MTLAQRRQLDRVDLQAIIEILAEGALGHHLRQVAVGRRNHAHRCRQCFVAPDAHEGVILEELQELGLGGGADLADFIEKYPDNVLYETDYPHPTSMSVGPSTPADHPRVYAERVLGALPDEMAGKVLHETAARLYGLD